MDIHGYTHKTQLLSSSSKGDSGRLEHTEGQRADDQVSLERHGAAVGSLHLHAHPARRTRDARDRVAQPHVERPLQLVQQPAIALLHSKNKLET